jgi:hypothetical protein
MTAPRFGLGSNCRLRTRRSFDAQLVLRARLAGNNWRRMQPRGRSGTSNFGSTLSERRYLRTVFRDSPVRRDISRIEKRSR